MQSFDDDEFEGSQDNGSEDDQDQNEDDVEQDENDDGDGDEDEEDEGDGDGDADGDNDGDGDGDGDGNADGDEDDDNDANLHTSDPSKRSGPAGAASASLGTIPILVPPDSSSSASAIADPANQSKSRTSVFPSVRPEALTAADYDVVPTIAAPQSTSINVIAATPDMRWVFSGGSDGYIRKFNWIDTANNKIALTVAQRQHLVDTISKAGVLTSYWENEDPGTKSTELGNNLSPVYSLAVHSRALWLLSGCESGVINLQSVRHDEGKTQHRLREHTSAVSVLSLNRDEASVLSGSWDKTVIDWDLNTGKPKRKFEGSSGQISSLEIRPLSSLPVPETVDLPTQSGTMSSDSASKPRTNGMDLNGDPSIKADGTGLEGSGGGSPADSLFGGQDNDSLFGGGDGSNGGQLFGDDDDFSRAIASGMSADNDTGTGGDVEMLAAEPEKGPSPNADVGTVKEETAKVEPLEDEEANTKTNGLPHAEDVEMKDADNTIKSDIVDQPVADTVFMTSSINGPIQIWDRRRQAAIAKISPKNVPPWCMGSCWSPDGNYIYAGRRNGTVEEFSLHKGFRSAERTFKFPQGSGPVSAVRALPNGRHLVCASYDTLRLYDLQQQQTTSKPPFLVISGHRTGIISQLYLDPSCRFLISAAGNRGWEGVSTQLLLGYEINI